MGDFTGVRYLASRAFVPTNAQNGLPAVTLEVHFCSLGPYPKPREQPRSRGWLRVRFPNAVVPALQGQAGLAPRVEPETTASVFPGKRKKRGWPTFL